MAHTVQLLRRTDYAGDVASFEFTRPRGYAYRAGQWCFLVLPDRGWADERGLRRHLSFTSAPEEGHLGFATKLSGSAFKRTLASLEPGDEIGLEPPRGALALPDDRSVPLCFLAGGIGVTPFRSLSVHAARGRTGHDVTLLVSSRTPEEALFLDEFQALAQEAPRFRFVATMTRMHQSGRPWDGPQGRMDAAFVRKGFPAWERGAFFVAGPPRMVETMLDLLADLGVPETRVTVEKFAGY